MLLSDHDILKAHDEGHIDLTPWTPEMVQPASIDVRLDRFFRLFNNHAYTYVDPAENQGELTEQFEVDPNEPWILHPGEFALGATWEYVKLDATIAARLEGKSSLGRLGILTHSTAGFIDPGFEGHITLELSNVSTLPVKLWPGMKIGQMCFFQLSSPCENPYGSAVNGSHYQGQRGPTPSRSYEHFYRADLSQQCFYGMVFCKNRKNSEEKYNIHREFSGCITVLLRIVWFYNSVEQNDRCMAPRIYSFLLSFISPAHRRRG